MSDNDKKTKTFVLETVKPEPQEPKKYTITREVSESTAPESTKSNKKTQYDLKYAKEKLKRIPLDVQKEKYEEIKAAAADAGETVNGFIKKAIDQRIERNSGNKP